MIIVDEANAVVAKLKAEWKTFTLAIMTTIAGAWELASAWGADIPSFFNWVPEQYKSGVLFAVGLGFLLLRRYQPTIQPIQPIPVQAPAPTVEPEATVTKV